MNVKDGPSAGFRAVSNTVSGLLGRIFVEELMTYGELRGRIAIPQVKVRVADQDGEQERVCECSKLAHERRHNCMS